MILTDCGTAIICSGRKEKSTLAKANGREHVDTLEPVRVRSLYSRPTGRLEITAVHLITAQQKVPFALQESSYCVSRTGSLEEVIVGLVWYCRFKVMFSAYQRNGTD